MFIVRILTPTTGGRTQVRPLITFITNVFTTRETRITALTAVSNPGETNTISYFQSLNRATHLANDANSLVTKHNWIVGDSPVVVTHMDISMAQSV